MINAGSIIASLDLDTGQFSTKLAAAQTSADGFAGKLKGYGGASQELGKGLTLGLTVPIVGIGVAATKTAIDYEAGMSRVKAISGATTDELAKLSEQALILGADTAFSASEASGGMESLASAGFSVNEIMLAMPGLLDLAAVSGGDVGLAADVAASALNGFGLEAGEAGHVADVLARAAADTNAEVADMGEAMKYIAPVAAAMGLSMEEVAAAVGILSDAGIKGGQAGTTLRGALTRLVKPSKDASEMINYLGMSFFDMEGNMLPLEGIIKEVKDGTEGLTQEAKNQALAMIFGQEALSGILTLVEAGPEKLNELTTSFENSDGAAKAMAETILDNGKGSVDEMMGALETAAIKIGTIVIPMVTSLSEKVGELADWFSNLDEGTQETIVKMAGLAAAIGPVLLVGGKAATGLGSIIGLFTKFAGGATAATTATTALGTAGGAGALGGLGTGLGASVIAMAPWIVGIGAVAAATALTVNYLKEDTIPAFELFDETISQSTQEALGKFMELEKGATASLQTLGLSGAIVTEEMKTSITTNTNEMADQVILKLEEQKTEGLKHLEEYFATSTDLSDKEMQEAIRIATEKYDGEILKATEGKARIEEILTVAKDNNKAIIEQERTEIEAILEELKGNSINLMTESQEEQEKILENLKNNADRITAEQMTAVIKNSLEQKEKTIIQAEEQYQGVLKSAELLKQDGTAESIKLADNMIAEAERQRKDTATKAEEMHTQVLAELKEQGGDLINQIDTDNGKIKTKWDELSDWFMRNPIIREIVTQEKKIATAERNDRLNPIGRNAQGTDNWRGGLSWVGEQGPEIVELPRGSKVYNNNESMDIVNQNSRVETQEITINTPVYLDGKQVTKITSRVQLQNNRGKARALGVITK